MKYQTAKTLACAALLLVGSLAVAALADQGSAKVQAVRSGSGQYSLDGVTWSALQTGTILNQGATVRTDSMGVVDLYLGDNGPTVRLTPSTTLSLTTLTITQAAGEKVVNTELGLKTGRIQGVVRKLSASSRYDVKTPVGTCGIRGTKYEISASGRVTVEEGKVKVYYTAPGSTTPTEFEVQPGYTFDPMLNNGRGGVIPTPVSLQDQLREDLRAMRTVTTEEEVVEIWLPSPSWMLSGRGVEAAGFTTDAPWNLPPILNPTTPPTPTHSTPTEGK